VEKKRKILLFVLVLGIMHAFYFLIAVKTGGIYMADSAEYIQQSENLKSSMTCYCGDLNKPLNYDQFTKRPPVYGLLIAALKLLFNSDFFIVLFQALLSISALTGLCLILQELGYSRYPYSFIPAFVLLFPPQAITANFVMAEILMQTFVFWSFFFFVKFVRTKETKYIFLYNVLLVFAVLTKPVIVLFWIPNVILSVYLYFKFRNKSFITASLIMPLVILAVCLFNLGKTGYFHYSSLKNNALLYYNAYFILLNTKGEETAEKEKTNMQNYLFSIPDYKTMSEERERMGWELIMNNKFIYAKLHAKGVMNFFFDPGRFDFLNYTGQLNEKNTEGMMFTFVKDGYIGVLMRMIRQNPLNLAYFVLVFTMNIILFAGFIVFLFKNDISSEIRIYAGMLVFFLGFMSGPLGSLRYKIHVLPVMLFGLIIVLSDFLSRRKTKKIVN